MSLLKVTDNVIWASHLYGAPAERDAIGALPEGTLRTFEIAGQIGVWEKMKNQPSGATTPGFRPVGPTKTWWNAYWPTVKGELKPFRIVQSS